MMSSMERLTVVIANYGTPEYTIRSVDALVADGVPPERIVVVDNGSADDSYAHFQERIPECVLLRLDENIGFAGASNFGAQRLAGDSYLFVNSDAFVHLPGSVQRLLEALVDQTVGLAVPRLLNEDLSLQPKVAPLNSPATALVRASGLSRFIPNRWQPNWSMHWDHAESREIQAVSGVVLLVRGETWEQLGGFDESALMYAEDLDLCWAARKAGWRVWFVHDAEFVHLGRGATSKEWENPRRAELVGRAEAAMIRRHLGGVRSGLTLGFIAAGLAARLAFYKAVGDAEAAAALRGSLRGYLR
jgi:N-acetylglucosaminyl-diphospho-decaprenol L-rhamnosyltransferase